jgi:hypothetical protein
MVGYGCNSNMTSNKYISAMDFLHTLVVVNSNSFISYLDRELVILYRTKLSYLNIYYPTTSPDNSYRVNQR